MYVYNNLWIFLKIFVIYVKGAQSLTIGPHNMKKIQKNTVEKYTNQIYVNVNLCEFMFTLWKWKFSCTYFSPRRKSWTSCQPSTSDGLFSI